MRRPWCAATRLLEHRETERRARDDAATRAAAAAARPGASMLRPPPRTGFPVLEVADSAIVYLNAARSSEEKPDV